MDKNVFIELFTFLYKNKDFYKAYLSTNEQTFMEKNDFVNYISIVNNSNIADKFRYNERIYHMAFFAGGIKAMAKTWISNGLKETPVQMSEILFNEYKINSKYLANKKI